MALFLSLFYWTSGLLQGLLQFIFTGFFIKRKPGILHCVIYLLLFQLVTIPGTSYGQFLFFAFLDLLLLWGADYQLLKGGGLASILAALLAISIRQLAFGIPNGILFICFPFVSDGTLRILLSIMAAALSLILCALGYYLTARHFALEDSPPKPFPIMLFSPAFLLITTGFYILNTAYGNVVVIPAPFEPVKHLELLLIQILCICAMFSSLYAYKKLQESYEMKSRLALLQLEAHSQKTYMAEAKARYEQTRSFRHDIKNHLIVLNGLLNTRQLSQAQSYLDKLEGAADRLSLSFQTGNPVVDILLSSKLALAHEAGIKTDCSILFPRLWNVDDLDLCIIFSNALDNAIQACAHLEGEKTIYITGEPQGTFYLLEFENSALYRDSHTPKPGIGLSNIKAVAEKYGGAVTIEYSSSRFYLDVLLNIS